MHTVSRIATGIGMTNRAVQQKLKNIPPAGFVTVSTGQQAPAWSVQQLPLPICRELEKLQHNRRCRSLDDVLHLPVIRHEPKDKNGEIVPLADIDKAQINRAVRLRSSLALSIRLKDRLDEDECREAGLREYRRVCGNASERHWRRLVRRTLQRDAGENRFDDWSLYLDENVLRSPAAEQTKALAKNDGDRRVLEKLGAVKHPSKPTRLEESLIWNCCCHFIADSKDQASARQRIQELITASGVALSASGVGLKRMIYRKYEVWRERGGNADALEDQREKRFSKSGNFRAPEPTEHDLALMKGTARKLWGGRLDQAWRALVESGGLSPAIQGYYGGTRQMPKRLRSLVAMDVKRMKFIHQGERAHELNGAHHTRFWTPKMVGAYRQGDDVTIPVWWYVTDRDWFKLMRGQFLLMCDEASGYVTAFSIIPKETYNALDIRELITQDCAENGLPSEGFKFELATWQSKILVGGKEIDPSGIVQTGLARFGLIVEKTLLPRGKIIERTIGQLQDYMEGLPGYSSRNERGIKNERFNRLKLDIESRKVDPRGVLLSQAEVHAELAHIIDRYNSRPQFGEKLKGISPLEAWKRSEYLSEPRIRFDAKTHYFLASEIGEHKVTKNGIRIQHGHQIFRYKGADTGRLVGERVLTWFNPNEPDLLPCTLDLHGTGLFVLARSFEIPPHGAGVTHPELLASENALIREHQAYASTLYRATANVLSPFAFRRNVASPSAIELGENIREQVAEKNEQRSAKQRIAGSIKRRAQRAGLPEDVFTHSEEAANALERLADAPSRFDEIIAKEAEEQNQ